MNILKKLISSRSVALLLSFLMLSTAGIQSASEASEVGPEGQVSNIDDASEDQPENQPTGWSRRKKAGAGLVGVAGAAGLGALAWNAKFLALRSRGASPELARLLSTNEGKNELVGRLFDARELIGDGNDGYGDMDAAFQAIRSLKDVDAVFEMQPGELSKIGNALVKVNQIIAEQATQAQLIQKGASPELAEMLSTPKGRAELNKRLLVIRITHSQSGDDIEKAHTLLNGTRILGGGFVRVLALTSDDLNQLNSVLIKVNQITAEEKTRVQLIENGASPKLAEMLSADKRRLQLFSMLDAAVSEPGDDIAKACSRLAVCFGNVLTLTREDLELLDWAFSTATEIESQKYSDGEELWM